MSRLLHFMVVLMVVGCSQEDGNNPVTSGTQKEDLIQFHIQQKDKEGDLIDGYVERRGWEVKTTGTGLRYWIYEKVGSDSLRTGDEVTFAYRLEFLDGTVCYSSDSTGSRTVKIGQSEAESGLHEAFTYLSTRDKAKIIIPSHLAFGLSGDYKKIPSQATLVYDVEIISVK